MPADPDTKKPGDEVPPGTPQSGEALCPQCSGNGTIDGAPCPECQGSGKRDAQPCANCGGTGVVTVTVGDA